MIKQALGIAVAAALGMTVAAQAADLTTETAANVVTEPAFNWTGFYAGVHAGYGWGDLTNDFAEDFFDGDGSSPDGWFGGGQIGYNYQFSNNVVLGIEADAAFADLKDSVSFFDYADFEGEDYYIDAGSEAKITALGTVRARAGYAVDRFLPYVTGGFAWANGKSSIRLDSDVPLDFPRFAVSDSQIFTGWTVGAGLEYAVTNNITAKVEYLYADLGKKDFNFGDGMVLEGELSSLQTVKFGLNYKF